MEYFHHDSIDAVMGLEIGGANGLEPFLVGSSRFFNTPVIDGDWMVGLNSKFTRVCADHVKLLV